MLIYISLYSCSYDGKADMESYSSYTKVLDGASSNTKELGRDVALCSCSAAKRRGEIPIFSGRISAAQSGLLRAIPNTGSEGEEGQKYRAGCSRPYGIK